MSGAPVTAEQAVPRHWSVDPSPEALAQRAAHRKRICSTSRYQPKQGDRERARRRGEIGWQARGQGRYFK